MCKVKLIVYVSLRYDTHWVSAPVIKLGCDLFSFIDDFFVAERLTFIVFLNQAYQFAEWEAEPAIHDIGESQVMCVFINSCAGWFQVNMT